jgi:sigma-B regulation protein RsbU (phosphoserine phosphatase)
MRSRTWLRLGIALLGALTLLSLVGRLAGAARPASSGGLSPGTLVLAPFILLPWICAAVGFFTAWRRPDDHRAWILLALLVSFGGAFGDNPPPGGWPAPLRLTALGFDAALNPSWPIWMLLFGIYFPERARLDRRWPWLKWILLAPLGVFAALAVVVKVGSTLRWAWTADLVEAFSALASYRVVLGMVAIGGFFALVGHKWGTSTSPDTRRRIRLLFTGASLSLTPMFLVGLWILLGHREGAAIRYPLLAASVFLPIFPVTLAYVIVVERAMDVGVVLRQGLQYALARNAVRAIQLLLSILVMLGVLTLAAQPDVNRPRRMMLMAIGIFLAASLGRLARRVQTFVDRRFFREALDTERLLHELGDDVRTIVETDVLLDVVSRRLSAALHVPTVVPLLESGGRLTPRPATAPGPPAAALPLDGPLVERLRSEARPTVVYPAEAHHWSSGLPERQALLALEAQLLIPLLLKERLLGLLLLGAKRSEAAYAPSDLKLLQSVSSQVALALENGRLTAAVAAEAARRERLNREIEIAREVQEGLFPQALPVVAGLDYAGSCRPARGVGGDYYDFLSLPGGRLGIAIGDVSGKGIPAALLMAGLQASLRGQATFGAVSLAELMARVNRLVCDSSSPNRYATFFYGEYTPGTSAFDYVNAGHNAPMLLRADGSVERLDQGGPVVGMIDGAIYEAGRTELRPGDRLLAFTDGLSEAMNPQSEEWGEARLLEAYRASSALPSALANAGLVAAADAFAAGAPQYDDMTVITLRVVGDPARQP